MKNIKKYFAIFAILTLGMVSLDAATNYAEAYAKLAQADKGINSVTNLKEIFSAVDFNHKNDTDIIRSSMSGLYTRKAFIKLSDADFIQVVSNALPFFSKSFGFSLIHGWMLNKFKDSTTPYYIGTYFSFDKFFSSMAVKMSVAVQDVVMRVWQSARANIINDANRWEYYDHMLYLPYAIKQAAVPKNASAPDMDLVIQNATRSVKWTGITLLKSNGQPVAPGKASKLEEKGVYMTPIDWTALNAVSINRMSKEQLIDILQTWKAILGPTALKCGSAGGIPSPSKGVRGGRCKIDNADKITEYINNLSGISPNLNGAKEYMTKDHGLLFGKGNGNRIQLMIQTLKDHGYAR